MKTKIICRKPVEVISSGLTRQQDLNAIDAVLIINPDKLELPADDRPFEFVISFGDPNEDTPDRC